MGSRLVGKLRPPLTDPGASLSDQGTLPWFQRIESEAQTICDD